MSIIIENVDSNPRTIGKHRYVLRINTHVINYFFHSREDGLAACLRAAADAVVQPDVHSLLEDFMKDGPGV